MVVLSALESVENHRSISVYFSKWIVMPLGKSSIIL